MAARGIGGRQMRIRTAGGIAALVVALSACGAGDDAKAAKAISDEIMSQSDDTFDVDRKQADCLGEGFVDKIGVDQLTEYGLLTDDLKTDTDLGDVTMSKKDADAAADVFVDCVDVAKLMQGSMGLSELDPAVAECVAGVMTEDVVHDAMAASFRGEDEGAALEKLFEPLTKCVTG